MLSETRQEVVGVWVVVVVVVVKLTPVGWKQDNAVDLSEEICILRRGKCGTASASIKQQLVKHNTTSTARWQL